MKNVFKNVIKLKKPVVDYRKLRPGNILEPQYRHLLLMLGWVWYLTMYVLTERFIPVEKCHVVHSVVDDMVPFNEYFILIYCSWYLLLVGSICYFAFYDIESFVNLQTFIIATQVIGVICYIIWPSVQTMRPHTFANDNFCTSLVQLIYSIDTPTGVCPSLHVGYSMAILSAWVKKEDAAKAWKLVLTVWVILISLSVMFVKQHSFTDVWTALIMCGLIEWLLFQRQLGKKYLTAIER
ncbi:phosphatase PAP2 family protein [Butyrivibrio sp. MC2013]|uniref:phosphatase PAP2 family protein n=1 Tax=Butyrivibrio sp. MC2013 TaxID=1280686 RepID=UPI0003F9EE4E|nr:phosphatase PAP2 family protein [Butyrivibrio sp. MC2013]